jgi:aldose 1-epimerase
MSLEKTSYGTMADGREVDLYIMTNANGLEARLISYGATLVSMKTPDRDGNISDITLGFDTIAEWEKDTCYFGATVGRCANRIAGGSFVLDGESYTLATNNGDNHLHGGIVGFNKALWDAEPFESDAERGVTFTYVSPDKEEGYPGELTMKVTYTLTDSDELRVEYEGSADSATIVNMTHHSYWNLATPESGSILDQELHINADHYLPVDSGAIPTGGPAQVEGTPMDFRKSRVIGERMDQVEGGYDHNWCLSSRDGSLEIAATLRDPVTGRVMEVLTTEPGIQFYAGNFLDGVRGKGGVPYPRNSGLCLETQLWPDSPNRPDFPSSVLRPGEKYTHTCVYRFSVR